MVAGKALKDFCYYFNLKPERAYNQYCHSKNMVFVQKLDRADRYKHDSRESDKAERIEHVQHERPHFYHHGTTSKLASKLYLCFMEYLARARRLVHRQAPWITLHPSIQAPTTPASIWWKITERSTISELSVETG
jgi:hypothetical protein